MTPPRTNQLSTLFALFMAILLAALGTACDGPGTTPPVTTEDNESAMVPPLEKRPTLEIRAVSAADTTIITATALLPVGYNTMELRPMLFAPGISLKQTPSLEAGQGIILCNATTRNCPKAGGTLQRQLLLADLEGLYNHALANLPVDMERCYLLASNSAQLAFACQNPRRFQGIVVALPDDDDGSWRDLPLENLLGIPVFLDTSVNHRPPAAARALLTHLRQKGITALAPEYIVKVPRQQAIAHGLSWLEEQPRNHHYIYLESPAALPCTNGWLRINAASAPGKAIAKATITRQQIRIDTENCAVIALDRSHPLLKQRNALPVFINRRLLLLPPLPTDAPSSSHWHQLYFNGEKWSATPPSPQSAIPKPINPQGTILQVLTRPFAVVYPAQGANATNWQESARRFRTHWQELTGCAPQMLEDRQYLQEGANAPAPIFFGGPEDNLAAKFFLESRGDILRGIYETLPEETRSSADLGCITIIPTGGLSQGQAGIVIAADSTAGCLNAWKPISDLNAIANSDYIVTAPQESTILTSGRLDAQWRPWKEAQ